MTNSFSALLTVAALARDAERELQARAREDKRRLAYRTNMISLRKQGMVMRVRAKLSYVAAADKEAAAKVYRATMLALKDSMQRQQQKLVLQALGLDASQPIVIV